MTAHDGVRSVLLIDCHAVILDGLAAALNQRTYWVATAATSWDEALAGLGETAPDFCIVEPALPGGGAEGIAQLVQQCPDSLVVVLTGNESPGLLNQALAAGATGYIHKTRSIAVVLGVLERVWDGEIVIEASFLRQRDEPDPPRLEVERLVHYLTPREWECLGYVAAGYATEGIAAHLGVSRTTVRSHVQSVLVKLGVHSRLEAAALVSRYGLAEHHAAPQAVHPVARSVARAVPHPGQRDGLGHRDSVTRHDGPTRHDVPTRHDGLAIHDGAVHRDGATHRDGAVHREGVAHHEGGSRLIR